MVVVAQAVDGMEGVDMTLKHQPDVILMDLIMPRMNGLEAAREIMHWQPTPIVAITASLESFETDIAFEAIGAGVLMVLQKPVGPGSPEHQAQVTELINTVRAMSSVRVIHHPRTAQKTLLSTVEPDNSSFQLPVVEMPEVIAIASSTGGPEALSIIFSQLPADFPVPIVVVQHIAPDFVSSLTKWLSTTTPLKLTVAKRDEFLEPGHIYIAPGGSHLRLNGLHRFEFTANPANVPHIPSGTVLLESVARSYRNRSVGIVLTGMGDDGAAGLRFMYDVGALTIAQDEATCVVFGMPREAIARGAARSVLPLPNIARELNRIVTSRG